MSIAFVEYKILCITDVDAMDRSYCSSLVVAVKFFDMASDIKAMKEMMQQSMRMKQGEGDTNPVEDSHIPKVDPKKFRWQMWMYIAIGATIVLLYFLS